MIKTGIREISQKFGYDFVKTERFPYGKSFKRDSGDLRFYFYNTPRGKYFLPKGCKGDIIANAMKEGKIFDQAIYDVAKSFIKPDSIVLDIGANYGQMSVELSKISDSIEVWAFEAQKMVYEILKMNVFSNGATNVKTFYNAVYDSNGIEFHFPIPDLVKFPSYGSYGLDLNSKVGVPP